MSPDDPRHGHRAGYIAGCRADCCAAPHYRYQKRSRMRLLTEGTQIVDATPVRERVAWWSERGVSINAIGEAAGLGYGTVAELVERKRDECLRSTVRAIEAVTWRHIPGRAHVYADITRRRIFSLMAAGHRLDEIAARTPYMDKSGRWRYQERVTAGLARAVLATCFEMPATGTSAVTLTKARNRGHVPLITWDDPGWLAAPKGWAPPLAAPEPRRAGRPEVTAAVIENAEWLADADETLTAVLKRLGLNSEQFYQACRRAGRLDLYAKLSRREPTGEWAMDMRRQAQKRGAA